MLSWPYKKTPNTGGINTRKKTKRPKRSWDVEDWLRASVWRVGLRYYRRSIKAATSGNGEAKEREGHHQKSTTSPDVMNQSTPSYSPWCLPREACWSSTPDDCPASQSWCTLTCCKRKALDQLGYNFPSGVIALTVNDRPRSYAFLLITSLSQAFSAFNFGKIRTNSTIFIISHYGVHVLL